MVTNLKRTCIFHIKSNISYYVLVLCGFLCGGIIAAACIFAFSELSVRELSAYLADFFESIGKNGTDSFEIFKIAVFSNLKFFIVLVLFSVMIIGLPFVLAMSGVFGYSFFFSFLFALKAYGIKGLLFFCGGMLLHHLITIPCFLLAIVISVKFSVFVFKGKSDIKSELLGYVLKMSGLFLFSVLGALLQSYVEPIFLELMAPVFVGG